MRKISVITPVFNQSAFTKHFLQDMSFLGKDNELIIVNNGSNDNTSELLSNTNSNEDFPRLVVINNDNNEGFACACNQAFRKSSGDIIIFLNNDIKVKKDNLKDWFIPLCNAIENNKNALVGPTGGYVDEKTYDFIHHVSNKNDKINYMCAWCLAADRQVFQKLSDDFDNGFGPFNAAMFAYYEDTFMGFQAKMLGIDFEIVSVPIVHFGGQTSKSLKGNILTSSKKVFTKEIIKLKRKHQ